MRKTFVSAVALAAGLAVPAFAQNAPANPTVPPGETQTQPSAQIGVNQPAPQVNVQQPAPQITVKQPEPQVTVTQPQPQVTIEQPKPEVTVTQPKPEVTVQQAQPNVQVQQPGQPNVQIQQPGQPNVVVKQPDQAGATSADMAAGATTGASPLWTMRGEQIIGKDVYGANGEEIGEVENIVLSQSGGSPGVVVGVGGFLGIGERHVVIPLDQIQLGPEDKLTTNLTKDSVSSLQVYDRGSWRNLEPNQTLNDAGPNR